MRKQRSIFTLQMLLIGLLVLSGAVAGCLQQPTAATLSRTADPTTPAPVTTAPMVSTPATTASTGQESTPAQTTLSITSVPTSATLAASTAAATITTLQTTQMPLTTTSSPAPTVRATPVPSTTSARPTPIPDPTTVRSSSVATTARPAASTPVTQPAPSGTPKPGSLAGRVIVLDPGHQREADYTLERLAPWSSATKIKCSSGTTGVATRKPEYIFTLEFSFRLRDLLQSLGAEVHLTRTTHDVKLGNIDRAQFALQYKPDANFRIHANGSDNQAVRGVSIYVPDRGPYAGRLKPWADQLSRLIAAQTGTRSIGGIVTAEFTGLNWSTEIPSFLCELGFMSNPDEDRALNDPAYQDKIARAFVQFIAALPPRNG